MDPNDTPPKPHKATTSITWRLLCVFVIVWFIAHVFHLHKAEISVVGIVVSAFFLPVSMENAYFLRAMGALFIGLGIVVAGTILNLFWLIAVVGLALTTIFWRNRLERNLKAALAFVGVFVFLYGAILVTIQLLS